MPDRPSQSCLHNLGRWIHGIVSRPIMSSFSALILINSKNATSNAAGKLLSKQNILGNFYLLILKANSTRWCRKSVKFCYYVNGSPKWHLIRLSTNMKLVRKEPEIWIVSRIVCRFLIDSCACMFKLILLKCQTDLCDLKYNPDVFCSYALLKNTRRVIITI